MNVNWQFFFFEIAGILFLGGLKTYKFKQKSVFQPPKKDFSVFKPHMFEEVMVVFQWHPRIECSGYNLTQ